MSKRSTPGPRKAGRPTLPTGEARNETIPVRVLARERKSYERAAKRAKLSLSEWMRQTLNAAAFDGNS